MLHKDNVVPGAKLRVNNVIKDGLPSYGDETPADHIKKTLYLSNPAMIGAFGGGWEINSGAILEVVKKPRKVSNINVCLVKVEGTTIIGEAYWCELRASATLVTEG